MILPITKIEVVENYPYGGLRTQMRFSVNFHSKRGFRSIKQSLNPKTNTWNKPHFGTYNDLVWMVKDENGFIEFHSMNINGLDSISAMSTIISENYDKLDIATDMNRFIIGRMLINVKQADSAIVLKLQEAYSRNVYSEISDIINNK